MDDLRSLRRTRSLALILLALFSPINSSIVPDPANYRSFSPFAEPWPSKPNLSFRFNKPAT